MDQSEGDFRARHHCPELMAGQRVGVRLGRVEIRARDMGRPVCWVTLVESGFMLLGGALDGSSAAA